MARQSSHIETHKAPRIVSHDEITSPLTSFPVDANPFRLIYVDLTYKCDYVCNYCYNPIRTLPDMDLQYFDEVCGRLPRKVLFRLLGGEPTLHPQFFDFIVTAHKYKHIVSFVTNGTKFTDLEFARELKRTNVPVFATLSMDGGRNNDDWYAHIANARCSEKKMLALANLDKAGIKRISVSAIVVRNLNEGVIPDLISISEEFKSVRYIHFRSAGKVGRFIDTNPYSVPELKDLILRFITPEQLTRHVTIDGTDDTPGNRCFGCAGCYQFHPDSKVEITFIDFAGGMTKSCWKRGKLVDRDFTVRVFFEDMIEFSNLLDENYPDYQRKIDPKELEAW